MTARVYARLLRPRIEEALADTPVVLVNGPRQSGKTTLVRAYATAQRRYLTLDDDNVAAIARDDPTGFVRELDGAVIDEVQRAPGLLLAIKRSVDEDRRPGRFLLTGSAHVLTLPTIADSLAGRMETLSLLPLAGAELEGRAGRWLDIVLAGDVPRVPAKLAKAHVGSALVQRVLRGGYPEVVARATARRRTAWASQYVSSVLSRDVRDIAAVDKLDHLPRLLAALAEMSGHLSNLAQLGGQVGLDSKTAGKYTAVFEQMFLLARVPPWTINRLARIVKSPKIQFLDSGLLASLLDLSESAITADRAAFGPLLEAYVHGELLKLASWSDDTVLLSTYRDLQQTEVDFVLERPRGQVVGVEVKASATVRSSDFAGLRKLAELAGRKWMAGVLLYDGVETLPMGDRQWMVPLSTLWLV